MGEVPQGSSEFCSKRILTLVMKLLHLSPSLSRAAGGIFEIECALARELTTLGVHNDAYGLLDVWWAADQHRWPPVEAKVFPILGPRPFGFSPGLRTSLKSSAHDILHLHALWMYPSLAASGWSRRHQKPYVVTPNGMLEPWALSNSALKKKLAGFLYENRMLRGAACLHANTEKEMWDIRSYGLRNPVCVIPNGIDLPDLESEGEKVEGRKSAERKILLFLGRLHPKKGLANALRAWKQALHSTPNIHHSSSHEWQFVVAGWDQIGHEAELKHLCKDLGLAYADVAASDFTDNRQLTTDNGASVIFTGPAFGEQKDQLLRSASAFILPSFSEGLPMSVLEAWSYRLPVLMTDHCNLPEGFAAGAAIRIGTDAETIVEGLRELSSLPTTDIGQPTTTLSSLGANGRALVERQFTWPMVASQMKEVYEWVLGGKPKPEIVITPR